MYDAGTIEAEPDAANAVMRVYRAIMRELEEQALAPGQRLVETELAARFGVGRNAVREAMQRLAARGVVDLSRHRSASIRRLDRAEAFDILDLAAVVTAFAAAAAARRYQPAHHQAMLTELMAALEGEAARRDPDQFSRVRRAFYRALLSIGANRELQRLFPAIGMHIVYSQFRSRELTEIRLADYGRITRAVMACDVEAAETASRTHVARVRAVLDAMNWA